MFDLLLFPIVRQPSLTDLGIRRGTRRSPPRSCCSIPRWSGCCWAGFSGASSATRRAASRRSSGASRSTPWRTSPTASCTGSGPYAAWRFLAGLGLAGELGAAVTLVSEILPKNLRAYGTAIVAGVGIFGTVTASLVGKYLPWRTAYFVGGGLGLVLLATRFSLRESAMFRTLGEQAGVKRGDFPEPLHARRALRPLRPLHPHRPADLVRGGDPHHVRARVRPEGRRDGTRGRGDRRGLLLQRHHARELRVRNPQPGLGKPQEGSSPLHPRDALRRRPSTSRCAGSPRRPSTS